MYIAVDIETTGFYKFKHDIIQLAAVAVSEELEIGEVFNCYLKPIKPQYWGEDAEKVHGINVHEALAFPKRRKGLVDFLHFLKPYIESFPMTFLYHGKNKFDYIFLKDKYLGEGLLDSFNKAFSQDLVLSTRDLAAECLELDNYKLNTVSQKLDIELNHHEAMSDAMACAKIFIELTRNKNLYTGDLGL